MNRLAPTIAGFLLALGAHLPAQDLALAGVTLLDGDGTRIEKAVLLISGGKVVASGADLAIPVGYSLVTLEGAFVTPALIDPGTALGLPASNENEEEREITPEIVYADSIDLGEPSFRRALASGVTTIGVLPGTRNIISGLSAVVRFTGPEGSPEIVDRKAALVAAMGGDPAIGNTRNPGSRFFRRPTTRMGTVWLFRQALLNARDRPPEEVDPGTAILLQALAGTLPLRITARPYFDIDTALSLAAEAGVRIAAIDEAQEAWRAGPAFQRSGIPIVFPPPSRPTRSDSAEPKISDLLRAARAGIPIALSTGRGLSALPLIEEARIARRLGLTEAQTLQAITSTPARILGLEKHLGTLAPGMEADLVIWTDNPLGPLGTVRCVLVQGRPVAGTLVENLEGGQ